MALMALPGPAPTRNTALGAGRLCHPPSLVCARLGPPLVFGLGATQSARSFDLIPHLAHFDAAASLFVWPFCNDDVRQLYPGPATLHGP
jgi:hypothetical protein